jgi:hypothetical protein
LLVNQCEEGSFVISLIGVGEHYWIVNFGQPICRVVFVRLYPDP